jgi:molecular chaperone DnaJ
MKDYYKILELEKTATLDEIKKTFRKLSKVLHPDKETGDKDKFQELNEAYQTLSDPVKRQAYDQGTTYKAPQPPVINHIGVRIPWTLQDLKNGKTIQVSIQRVIVCKTCQGVGSLVASSISTCTHCSGTGRFIRQERTPFGFITVEQSCGQCHGTGEFNTLPCPDCHGEKMVNADNKETVIIPPNTIFPYSVTGKGHNTIHGDSDLIIHFDFQDLSGIRFIGDALALVVKVDFFEALLGKEQLVKFGDTTLKVSMPKESKEGQGFRLSKAYCGVDVLIHIKVESPTIKQMQEYILGLFKEETKLLPLITKRINESLK